MKRRLPDPARRWSVASRTLAAIVGGYGFIWLFTAAMTLVLRDAAGVPAGDAVLAATMASFLIWAVVAMAVFHARTARQAWLELLIGCLASMAILVVMTGRVLP